MKCYTQGTNQFIESQLEETRQRLVEHEKKLEEYRTAARRRVAVAADVEPDSGENAQMQLQSLNDTLDRDRDRLQALERELNELMTPGDRPRRRSPATSTLTATSGTAAQQLEAARRQLRQLELRLKPEHPDIGRAEAHHRRSGAEG